MSFEPESLNVLAYADGFTLWHDRSGADSLASLTSSEGAYFAPASELLRRGDIVFVSARDGTRIACVGSVSPDSVDVGLLP